MAYNLVVMVIANGYIEGVYIMAINGSIMLNNDINKLMVNYGSNNGK